MKLDKEQRIGMIQLVLRHMEWQRDVPVVLLIDVTEGIEALAPPVVVDGAYPAAAIHQFDSVDDFQGAALANNDEVAVNEVRNAFGHALPDRMCVCLRHDGGYETVIVSSAAVRARRSE